MGGDPNVVIQFVREHFRTASIGMGEEDPLMPAAPTSGIAAELEELIRSNAHEFRCYFDLVAWR
jgi:hypothetical protein